ncbi:hypothetical protein [Chryseobacterium sp. RR2-3-20]|uniref:hypothetical protein n=1 Tax=Chryseobacterium sp. RR2-3-20 TaxID=2787626 RepID=UPI001ADF5721|nr:hypothetical protein [Chryseobacterium sp. RR2-3-20]
MQKVIIVFTLIISNIFFGQARKKAERDTEQWRYEVECAGTGAEGTYLVKVWSYSKRGNVAIEQAKKNAVHGVVFKGFVGNGRDCITQKALATNPNIEVEQKAYFDNFFEDGGKYIKYVNVSSDGNIDAKDRMKVGREYKIGIVVSVMKDALRKDLESAGVIRGLSSGF